MDEDDGCVLTSDLENIDKMEAYNWYNIVDTEAYHLDKIAIKPSVDKYFDAREYESNILKI